MGCQACTLLSGTVPFPSKRQELAFPYNSCNKFCFIFMTFVYIYNKYNWFIMKSALFCLIIIHSSIQKPEELFNLYAHLNIWYTKSYTDDYILVIKQLKTRTLPIICIYLPLHQPALTSRLRKYSYCCIYHLLAFFNIVLSHYVWTTYYLVLLVY